MKRKAARPRPSHKSILLPGMLVEVLPAREILRTLDTQQCLDGLPFMPEMLPYCGRSYKVALRAELACVSPPEVPFRRLDNCVVLAGLRCDGSKHGGCQLGCMFFWKEAWLRAPDTVGSAEDHVGSERAPVLRVTVPTDPDRWFCQATQLRAATQPGEPRWKPGQYVRMLRVGTLTPVELVAMCARPVRRRLARLFPPGARSGRRHALAHDESLGLTPGDWVEVKSRDEILHTLDSSGRHHGLAFSHFMYRQCGKRFRVQRRAERIIVEATGRLRPIDDTVILEGSICDRYNGCARGMPMLWREAWLKRIDVNPDRMHCDPRGPYP